MVDEAATYDGQKLRKGVTVEWRTADLKRK